MITVNKKTLEEVVKYWPENPLPGRLPPNKFPPGLGFGVGLRSGAIFRGAIFRGAFFQGAISLRRHQNVFGKEPTSR